MPLHPRVRRHIYSALADIGKSIYGYLRPKIEEKLGHAAEYLKSKGGPKGLINTLAEDAGRYIDERYLKSQKMLKDTIAPSARHRYASGIDDGEELEDLGGWDIIGDTTNPTFGYSTPHSPMVLKKEAETPMGIRGSHKYSHGLTERQMQEADALERQMRGYNLRPPHLTSSRFKDTAHMIEPSEKRHARMLFGLQQMGGVVPPVSSLYQSGWQQYGDIKDVLSRDNIADPEEQDYRDAQHHHLERKDYRKERIDRHLKDLETEAKKAHTKKEAVKTKKRVAVATSRLNAQARKDAAKKMERKMEVVI